MNKFLIAALVVLVGCVQLSLASSDNCKDFNKWLKKTMDGNLDGEVAFRAASESREIQGNEKLHYAFKLWKELREAKDKSIEEQVELASKAASWVHFKNCESGLYERYVLAHAANIFKQPEAVEELLKPLSGVSKELLDDFFNADSLRAFFEKTHITQMDSYTTIPSNYLFSYDNVGELLNAGFVKRSHKPSHFLEDMYESAKEVIMRELIAPCKEYNYYMLEPMYAVYHADPAYAGKAPEEFKFPYFIHNVCMMARIHRRDVVNGVREFFLNKN